MVLSEMKVHGKVDNIFQNACHSWRSYLLFRMSTKHSNLYPVGVTSFSSPGCGYNRIWSCSVTKQLLKGTLGIMH